MLLNHTFLDCQYGTLIESFTLENQKYCRLLEGDVPGEICEDTYPNSFLREDILLVGEEVRIIPQVWETVSKRSKQESYPFGHVTCAFTRINAVGICLAGSNKSIVMHLGNIYRDENCD